MSPRFQRLLIIILSLFFFTFSVLLILFNSKENLIFFYTPSELLESKIEINKKIRIGGFVKKDSLSNKGNNKYSFIITDNNADIDILYEGLLPDLFREEQGIVAQGKLIKKNKIQAINIFAKHDENYIPASIKKELEKNQYWKKKY